MCKTYHKVIVFRLRGDRHGPRHFCPSTVGILESVHFFLGFWAHFPGVAVSKCKVPLLLHFWVLYCYTFELLYLLLISLYCYSFEVFNATPFELFLSATPLGFPFCCSFVVFTATPLKCLLLHLWAFSSATPLGFLFCYSFGISVDTGISNLHNYWE